VRLRRLGSEVQVYLLLADGLDCCVATAHFLCIDLFAGHLCEEGLICVPVPCVFSLTIASLPLTAKSPIKMDIHYRNLCYVRKSS
jgi:hypothetical protein